MCYLDKTFCSSDCKNQHCNRFWTDELHEGARQWWKDLPGDAPVAFSDFSPTCKEYLKP